MTSGRQLPTRPFFCYDEKIDKNYVKGRITSGEKQVLAHDFYRSFFTGDTIFF